MSKFFIYWSLYCLFERHSLPGHSNKDCILIYSDFSTKSADRRINFSFIFYLPSFSRETTGNCCNSIFKCHSVSVDSSRDSRWLLSGSLTEFNYCRVFYSIKSNFFTRSSVPRLLLHRSPPAIFFTIRAIIVYPIQCSVLWSELFAMLFVTFIHIIIKFFKAIS